MGPGAAGADAETVFHHVFQLVQAKWPGSFPNKSAYNRNFSKSLQEKVWRYKKENPAQQITGEWLEILAAAEDSACANSAAEAAAAATLAAVAASRSIHSPPQARSAGEEAI